MMSPEEKATWLIREFKIDSESHTRAKKCAIICVEQIMAAIEKVAGGADNYWDDSVVAAFEYYKEVLEYLKTL